MVKGTVRNEVQNMVERIHVGKDEGRENKRTKTAVLKFVQFLITDSSPVI